MLESNGGLDIDPEVDPSQARSPLVSEGHTRPPGQGRRLIRATIEWILAVGGAILVALVLRAFVVQAFSIPSESMEDTLLVSDRVLVNKLSYAFGEVSRGDVVVFPRPESQPAQYDDFIKRVIGLPGETIEGRNNQVLIDGEPLLESYLADGETISTFGPLDVPEGHVFVMGDNRNESGDSRVFGTIEIEAIVGRASMRYWPLDRIGLL